jgi:hypothetical protein
MDPKTNPFGPGAGTQPPELAGRGKIIADAAIALGRVKLGRPAKSQMLLGLRGVGKTVLLSPQHGDTAFTVPMFDEFMRRSMPDWTPAAPAGSQTRKRARRRARGR